MEGLLVEVLFLVERGLLVECRHVLFLVEGGLLAEVLFLVKGGLLAKVLHNETLHMLISEPRSLIFQRHTFVHLKWKFFKDIIFHCHDANLLLNC